MEAETMPRRAGGDGGGKDPHLPRLASGDWPGNRGDWERWDRDMGDPFARVGRSALTAINGNRRWPVTGDRFRTDRRPMGQARLPETAARLAFTLLDQQDEAA